MQSVTEHEGLKVGDPVRIVFALSPKQEAWVGREGTILAIHLYTREECEAACFFVMPVMVLVTSGGFVMTVSASQVEQV